MQQINNVSPKIAIHIDMDKTPTVLGGREEHFGSITDMIVHWEGMEEGGGEICLEGGGTRKRLSQRICELSGKFGEGSDKTKSNQSGTKCKEGEEGLKTSSSSLRNAKVSKLSSGLEDKTSNILVGNTRPTFTFTHSSNPNNVSTNQSSLLRISSSTQTNQVSARGVKRKGNWTTDQGGLLKKERRVFKLVDQ